MKKSKSKSKIKKRTKTNSKLKKVYAPIKKTLKVKTKKNYEQIITELREKGVKLKDIAKSAKISTRTLRKYRNYFIGNRKGGEKPSKVFENKLKAIAKRHKVASTWNLKVFSGEKIGSEKIKLRGITFPKGSKYVHVIMNVKFTTVKGNTFEKLISQVYEPSDGKKKIEAWAREYLNSMSTRPYIRSIELLSFTVNVLQKWYTEK